MQEMKIDKKLQKLPDLLRKNRFYGINKLDMFYIKKWGIKYGFSIILLEFGDNKF